MHSSRSFDFPMIFQSTRWSLKVEGSSLRAMTFMNLNLLFFFFKYQKSGLIFLYHKSIYFSNHVFSLEVDWLKDCLPYLFHNFRNKYFNKISLDNMLYVQNKLYRF